MDIEDVAVLLSRLRKAERHGRIHLLEEEDTAWRALGCEFTRRRPVDASQYSLTSQPLPEAIAGMLYPHQVKGIEFLRRMHLRSTIPTTEGAANGGGGGCILADDMGLGKTVQASAFVGDFARRGIVKNVLLIAPTSTLDAWRAALVGQWGQLAKPGEVVMFTGTGPQRQKQWAEFRYSGRKAATCVLVTTSGVLHTEAERLFRDFRFDMVVLDEAQIIRNPSTKNYKSITQLKAQFRLALTGTPVMNSILDLWALCQLVDPLLIPHTRARFTAASALVTKGNERDASDADKMRAVEIMEEVKERVSQVTLRRTKGELGQRPAQQTDGVGDATGTEEGRSDDGNTDQRVSPVGNQGLPPLVQASKLELVVWVRPTVEQRRLYDSFLSSDEVTGAMRAAVAKGKDSGLFVLLSSLKKICDHPFLNLTRENVAHVLRTPFEPAAGALGVFGSCMSSAKVDVCLRLVRAHMADAISPRKTVIFTESRVMIAILATVFAHCLPAAGVITFTGDVRISERAALLDRWNTDPSLHVCLTTTQVGGVGVTMTGASRAIIVDPSWNPAVDSQAVDRVHRIGQTRDVIVYRLVTCGTVEEKAYRRQIAKLAIARQIYSAAAAAASDGAAAPVAAASNQRYFTRSQMRDLFVYTADEFDTSLTAQMVRKMHGRTVSADVLQHCGLLSKDANADDGDDDHHVVDAGRQSLRISDMGSGDACVVDVSDHGALFQDVVNADALHTFLQEVDQRAADGRRAARGRRKRQPDVDVSQEGAGSATRRRRRRGQARGNVGDDDQLVAAAAADGDLSPFSASQQQLQQGTSSQQQTQHHHDRQLQGTPGPTHGRARPAPQFDSSAAEDAPDVVHNAVPPPSAEPSGEASTDAAVEAVRSARVSFCLPREEGEGGTSRQPAPAPPSAAPSCLTSGRPSSAMVGRKSCAIALFQPAANEDDLAAFEASAIADAQRNFGVDVVDEAQLLYECRDEDDDVPGQPAQPKHGDVWDSIAWRDDSDFWFGGSSEDDDGFDDGFWGGLLPGARASLRWGDNLVDAATPPPLAASALGCADDDDATAALKLDLRGCRASLAVGPLDATFLDSDVEASTGCALHAGGLDDASGRPSAVEGMRLSMACGGGGGLTAVSATVANAMPQSEDPASQSPVGRKGMSLRQSLPPLVVGEDDGLRHGSE